MDCRTYSYSMFFYESDSKLLWEIVHLLTGYVTWRAWMSLLWMWQGLICLKGAAMPVLTRIYVRWSVVTTGGSITGCEAIAESNILDSNWHVKRETQRYIPPLWMYVEVFLYYIHSPLYTGWLHSFEIFPPWILAIRCPKVIHRNNHMYDRAQTFCYGLSETQPRKVLRGSQRASFPSHFAIAKGLVKYYSWT